MIKIKIATNTDVDVLAHLGRKTWDESHGHYIDDKKDLLKHLDKNFSVSKTKQDLYNSKNIFFIIYVDDLPVGYAKLILNKIQEKIASKSICQLERIFIKKEFIPLKIGHQLLTFVEEHAKALKLDTMWLTVYIKNNRAIRFYEKNEFKNVGGVNYIVNEKEYENIVFAKKL
jgi:ribosomal protein S18 acetylase RimI-like enzyme